MTTWYQDGYDSKPTEPMYSGSGKRLRTVHAKHAMTAASLTDGDIFILAGPLSLQARVHRIFSPNATPALTSASDNDIGFYYMKNGTLTEADKDILVDGMTLASALSTRDLLLHGNSSLDHTKNIAALLGLQQDKEYSGGVYLALTMNTKSSANGTLDLDVQIEEGPTV